MIPARSPPRRRWAKRLALAVAAALAAAAVGLGALLVAWSPGRPRAFVDASGRPLPGSLSEKIHVEINGVRQGMFIESKDVKRPVLLYVHGGMPDYFLTQDHPTGWEEAFTVVWWEQRGSGLSASASIPRETLTMEQLVADVLAVARYLRERFGKDRVYLMGHSGGTFIALQAAARAPELFHAYVGVAQMSFQLESERLAHAHLLRAYEEAGDARMAARLRAAPVTLEGGTPPAYVALRDDAMHELGVGTMHDMRSVVSGLLLPSLRFRGYTVGEKWALWSAKARSGVSVVWDEMLATDLRARVRRVAIPVYFLHGVFDYTVSYDLARAYLAELEAPVKGFYSFRASAHSPMFEEPAAVLRVLQEDVLGGRSQLADPPPPAR